MKCQKFSRLVQIGFIATVLVALIQMAFVTDAEPVEDIPKSEDYIYAEQLAAPKTEPDLLFTSDEPEDPEDVEPEGTQTDETQPMDDELDVTEPEDTDPQDIETTEEPETTEPEQPEVDEWAQRQQEVHEVAELLRSLGVAEDDLAMVALGEEWWRCEVYKTGPLFTDEEVIMLAKTMWGEARGISSKTEIACIGWTVCNHIDDPQYQVDTVKAALTWPGRFYYKASFPVRDDLVWLARDVLERWNMEKLGYTGIGRVLPSDYCFYSGDGQHNWFRNAYRGGTRWDYSLPSPYDS